MTMPIGDHIVWLLLDRVHGDHVTAFVDLYSDDGDRVFGIANTALGTLHECRRLEHVEWLPDRRERRVRLTEAGLADYRKLCERRRGESP